MPDIPQEIPDLNDPQPGQQKSSSDPADLSSNDPFFASYDPVDTNENNFPSVYGENLNNDSNQFEGAITENPFYETGATDHAPGAEAIIVPAEQQLHEEIQLIGSSEDVESALAGEEAEPLSADQTIVTINFLWVGDEDALEDRPQDINFSLMLHETVIAGYTANADTGSIEVSDLPSFDANGQPAEYTLNSYLYKSNDRYKMTCDYDRSDLYHQEISAVFTYIPPKEKEYSIHVIMDDAEDLDHIRPETVTLIALQGESEIARQDLHLNSSSPSLTFTLPTFDENGIPAVYTFAAVPVNGYVHELKPVSTHTAFENWSAIFTHIPETNRTLTVNIVYEEIVEGDFANGSAKDYRPSLSEMNGMAVVSCKISSEASSFTKDLSGKNLFLSDQEVNEGWDFDGDATYRYKVWIPQDTASISIEKCSVPGPYVTDPLEEMQVINDEITIHARQVSMHIYTIRKEWIDEENRYGLRPDYVNAMVYQNNECIGIYPLSDEIQLLLPMEDKEGNPCSYAFFERKGDDSSFHVAESPSEIIDQALSNPLSDLADLASQPADALLDGPQLMAENTPASMPPSLNGTVPTYRSGTWYCHYDGLEYYWSQSSKRWFPIYLIGDETPPDMDTVPPPEIPHYTSTWSNDEDTWTFKNTLNDDFVCIDITKIWDDNGNTSGQRPEAISFCIEACSGQLRLPETPLLHAEPCYNRNTGNTDFAIYCDQPFTDNMGNESKISENIYRNEAYVLIYPFGSVIPSSVTLTADGTTIPLSLIAPEGKLSVTVNESQYENGIAGTNSAFPVNNYILLNRKNQLCLIDGNTVYSASMPKKTSNGQDQLTISSDYLDIYDIHQIYTSVSKYYSESLLNRLTGDHSWKDNGNNTWTYRAVIKKEDGISKYQVYEADGTLLSLSGIYECINGTKSNPASAANGYSIINSLIQIDSTPEDSVPEEVYSIPEDPSSISESVPEEPVSVPDSIPEEPTSSPDSILSEPESTPPDPTSIPDSTLSEPESTPPEPTSEPDSTEPEPTSTPDSRQEEPTSTPESTPGESTSKQEIITVSGRKIWDDSNNYDKLRPETITVRLFADGKECADQIVSEKTGWSYEFENLPADASGKEIQYTIDEDSVQGYIKTVSGYNLINTHHVDKAERITEDTIMISGSKTWQDSNNADGIRPSSITVKLFGDGKLVASTRVSEETQWKYLFTNLPRSSGGKAIQYTIDEDPVNGYTMTVNGYNLINTHTPAKTTITPTQITPTTPSGTSSQKNNVVFTGDRSPLLTLTLISGAALIAIILIIRNYFRHP